jgi:hypothetical protein
MSQKRGTAKRGNVASTGATTSSKKRGGGKNQQRNSVSGEERTGAITIADVVDLLCPKMEFKHEEELAIPEHPVLGSRLSWRPTPIDSSEQTRQLLYILTASPNLSESQHREVLDQLYNQFAARKITSKLLSGLSRHIDSNIVIIEQNSFHVITPDPKVFNTSRYSVLVYSDGLCYHMIDDPVTVLQTLLKRRPSSFRQIVAHDSYSVD